MTVKANAVIGKPGHWLQRRSIRIGLMALILGVAFFGVPALVNAADPSGAETLAADATAPINMAWTLVAAFLVFFMQLGFGFLGSGLIRKKSNVNYWTKSFMDFCIASLGFWAFGFALMFGGSGAFPGLDSGNAFMGLSGFFLTGEGYDVSTIMFWLFQMVFAATACTIVAGAVAERMKITAYLAYSFIIQYIK
jgi:Amt family ammonium transporter